MTIGTCLRRLCGQARRSSSLPNLKDFPADVLKSFGIEPQSPDEFVLNLLDLAPGAVAAIVSTQAADLKSPPQTRDQLLETLIANGLVRSVAKPRELFA